MTRHLLLGIVAVLWLLPAAAVPQAAPTAEVTDVIDADTVVIAPAIDGAGEVRLVGIQAPKLPLGRPGFEAWPLAKEAQYALAQFALGAKVRLDVGTTPMDRHGRHLAHLYRADDGRWVQGWLLQNGLARVYTFPDNRLKADEMLALERQAREAQRGIWRHPFYAIRDADNVDRLQADVGTFQLVEGRVKATAKVGRRIFLNFADDWRSDFTVVIPKEAWTVFAEAGIDPISLEGRAVRVRGWLKRWNGPMIELDHPERLERLP